MIKSQRLDELSDFKWSSSFMDICNTRRLTDALPTLDKSSNTYFLYLKGKENGASFTTRINSSSLSTSYDLKTSTDIYLGALAIAFCRSQNHTYASIPNSMKQAVKKQ